jgi:hypothetical protein
MSLARAGGNGSGYRDGQATPTPPVPDRSILVAMDHTTVRMIRLFTGPDGVSRFADVDVPLRPGAAPDELSVSEPMAATAVLFGGGPAGGGHAEQPEARRQLIIGISGTAEITAGGETRILGPGDVLLAEDLTGAGHSSRSESGFTAAVVVLAGPA